MARTLLTSISEIYEEYIKNADANNHVPPTQFVGILDSKYYDVLKISETDPKFGTTYLAELNLVGWQKFDVIITRVEYDGLHAILQEVLNRGK